MKALRTVSLASAAATALATGGVSAATGAAAFTAALEEAAMGLRDGFSVGIKLNEWKEEDDKPSFLKDMFNKFKDIISRIVSIGTTLAGVLARA